MMRAKYEPRIYAGLDPDAILARLRMDGWYPIPIRDPAGSVYPPHSHAESKLLAILEGSMEIHADGTSYRCLPGDQIVIPGGAQHSAQVGPDGCTFYWSEQQR